MSDEIPRLVARRLRALLRQRQTPAAGGGFTDAEAIWPSEILKVLDGPTVSDINVWKAKATTAQGSYDPAPPDIITVEPLWKRTGTDQADLSMFNEDEEIMAIRKILELLDDLDNGEAIVITKDVW